MTSHRQDRGGSHRCEHRVVVRRRILVVHVVPDRVIDTEAEGDSKIDRTERLRVADLLGAWTDISYVIGGYIRQARFIDLEGYTLVTGVTGVDTQWNLSFPPNGTEPGFGVVTLRDGRA